MTRLVDVEWNVGRTGIIAPRAVLEPVVIDGVTVTYATLHNPADIERRDLRIGDAVYVLRAGDVIPRVEAPLVEERTGAERPIVFPEVCPRCGDAIDRAQQRWRCVRGRGCQAVASVVYAAGRDQLDIEGLGDTRAVQLVEAGLVADIGDLFTLTREQLLGLERMGRPVPTICSPRSRSPAPSRSTGCSARSASGAPGAPCPAGSPPTSVP